MNIDQILNTETMLTYAKSRVREPYFLENLFPEKKIQGLNLAYIKGANSLPVAATIHSFNTESELAERDKFNEVKQKLALIKRKIQMDEELLIQLRSMNDYDREEAIKAIYDDVDNMVEAVRAKAEYMRGEVLSTGKLTTKNDNGVNVTLDYLVPDTHKEILTTTWDTADAKPLEDIKRWADTIQADTGVRPVRALTSTKVLNALLMNQSIRKAALGVNSEMVLTRTQLNTLLSTMELPVIVTYDGLARVEKADKTGYEAKKFVDDNKFIMFPEGKLGDSVYGLTAEEIELTNEVDKSLFGNITVVTYRDIDPVARYTKAVATMLPTFPEADKVFIADVLK